MTTESILRKKFDVSTTVHFDVSFEDGRGDLTTSIALQRAKEIKKAPKEIADAISEGLSSIPGVQKIEVAGNGYINVILTSTELSGVLTDAMSACEPKKAKDRDAPVIVEYSGPNIAKPLGIHHILSSVIGQSIANIYRHAGFRTISLNHIGDWGTQFGKLAVAYRKWGTKSIEKHTIDELLSLYVQFHTEAEKNEALEDEGRLAFKKLEEGDTELRAFWQSVVDITMKSMEKLYEKLHVHFDFTHGESFYEDKMAPIIEEGKKKKVFTEGKEGALIVEFPEATKLPPAIVIKADGSTIYLTRDLATARYRIDTWHPQAILYVVDVAQQLYFRQLFLTLEMLKWELPKLEHVLFGRMRFADTSMSTRRGNILKLEEVLDEAVSRAEKIIQERGEKIQTDDPKELAEMMGIGSVVYGVLSQNRKMDMVFDWDKMLSFDGNSAPYLQYTYARARSVLRKAEMEHASPITATHELSQQERHLTKLLGVFGEVLESARTEHLPSRLCQYLYDVCQAFNSFYNTDDILKSEPSVRLSRLGLTATASTVLRTGAHLLTLSVPERM